MAVASEERRRLQIDAYGDGGFRVAGEFHLGAILLLPHAVHLWPHADVAAVVPANLGPVLEAAPRLTLLLLGTGARMTQVSAVQRQVLRAAGLAIEVMDTGAACRTFNVLALEERRVAAVLMPRPD